MFQISAKFIDHYIQYKRIKWHMCRTIFPGFAKMSFTRVALLEVQSYTDQDMSSLSDPFLTLTAHNWQKWKRVFLICPCHKIYRDEAVTLKSCRYTWKITIFVKMWNLGQYRENLIFFQKMLNWSSNLKILSHMCDTYNCDYLKHSTFRFNLIDFQLNTDSPFQFCPFYRKIT